MPTPSVGLAPAPGPCMPNPPAVSRTPAPARASRAPDAPALPQPVRPRTPTPSAPRRADLTERQERFCHLYLLWSNASEAARGAGYSPATARQQGSRLLQDGRVRDRLKALHRGLGSDYGLDPVVLVGKLETVYRQAMNDGHYHAATRAVEIQARIAGVCQAAAGDGDGASGACGAPE